MQDAVDLPVPGAGQAVADAVAGGGVGAVPFQEAKCPRSGNLVISATSTSSRAAPDGPIPSGLISVVPVALSAAISSLSAAFLRW